MNEDPIVAEVRRIREQRARRFGFDIHKTFADLMARGGAEDRAHAIVQDASKWAEAIAAKDLQTVKEEPRNEGVE